MRGCGILFLATSITRYFTVAWSPDRLHPAQIQIFDESG